MEQKAQYDTLSDIASIAMPGELIRHTSWRPGLTITTSTELLRGFGGYRYAARAREDLRGMPEIRKPGKWGFAGKYPPRPFSGTRGLSPMINNVPDNQHAMV